MIKHILASFLVFSLSVAQADTKFEEISVGSVVQNRIIIDNANHGIPIPPGEWINTGKITELDQFSFPGGSEKKPKHSFTFINKSRADSPIFALIVTFFPEVRDTTWGKPKCESTGGSIAVGLDTQSDPTSYVCAQVWSESKFKETIANAEKSSNQHVRLKLVGLKDHLEKLPDEILSANILGSKDHAAMLNYTFFLERVANPNKDASYAAYIKMGMRDYGLTIWDALKGKEAVFSVAKAYEPVSGVAEQSAPSTGATIPYLENVSLKVGQTAVIHGARGSQCGQPAPSWENIASTLPTPATGKLSDGGDGVRFTQRCGGETPARAIRFTATTPGSEQIKLFGDPIRIEVQSGADANALKPVPNATERTTPIGSAIPYLEKVVLTVGQTAIIYGARGSQCGQPAPDWEKIAPMLPTPTTGKFSDGGEGVRSSQRCGGPTPARAIYFTATTPGSDQIRLFGDPVRIEVH